MTKSPQYDQVYDLSAYITTQADSQAMVDQNISDITECLSKTGAHVTPCQLFQLEGWQCTLPLGVDRLGLVTRVMTPIVGTMWPFFADNIATPMATKSEATN